MPFLEFAEWQVGREAVMLGHGGQELRVVGVGLSAPPHPWPDRALVQRQIRVGNHQIGIDLEPGSDALTLRAGAMGTIEGKGSGLDLTQRDPVVNARELLGEEDVRRRLGRRVANDHDSVPQLQGSLDGVGQPSPKLFAVFGIPLPCTGQHKAVDHRLNGVHLVSVQLDRVVHIADLSIDADPHEPGLLDVFKDPHVLSLPVLDQGSEHDDAGALRQGQNRIDDLLRSLLGDLTATLRAMGDPDPCVEQA